MGARRPRVRTRAEQSTWRLSQPGGRKRLEGYGGVHRRRALCAVQNQLSSIFITSTEGHVRPSVDLGQTQPGYAREFIIPLPRSGDVSSAAEWVVVQWICIQPV